MDLPVGLVGHQLPVARNRCIVLGRRVERELLQAGAVVPDAEDVENPVRIGACGVTCRREHEHGAVVGDRERLHRTHVADHGGQSFARGFDDPYRASCPGRVLEHGPEPLRHPMVGEQVVLDSVFVPVANHVGLERAPGADRLSSQAAGQQRLTDALACHHVGRGGGIAHEQYAPRRQ